MKKILLVIGLFILLPTSTKAVLCDYNKKIAYQKQAQNISVSYEYIETEDDAIFNIKFGNIPEQFIVYDATNYYNYFRQGDGRAFGIRNDKEGNIAPYTPIDSEFTIENVEKNKSYTFQIFVNDSSCIYKIMYTHYITIPGYNKFYKDKLCEGIEEYKLCKKFVNINMSYDEWKNKVSKYIDSLKKDEIVEETEEIKGVFDYLLDFYLEYYYFILPGIILIMMIGMVAYNKKHDLF